MSSPFAAAKNSFVWLFFAFTGICAASAHETWLLPTAFDCAPGTPVTLSLTSGMSFPTLDHAILPERVATAYFRQKGASFPLLKPTGATSSLEFPCLFQKTGLVTAWVTLHPKTLELSEEKVAEYLAEIDASTEVRNRWASFAGKRKWRETYTKCAKTFVVVGPASADKSSSEPVGMPLEIVPKGDSATMKMGERSVFRLFENGKPLAAASLGLITSGSGRRVFQKTDENGCASFTLDSAGTALLFAVQLRWRGDQWTSTFTTLSVRIQP